MLQEKLKEIKQSLRLYMNGVTAQSLREKGLNYHLNWGASLQHLQEMAAEIREDVAKNPHPDFNLQCSMFNLFLYLCTQYFKKGINYGFIYCRQDCDGRPYVR